MGIIKAFKLGFDYLKYDEDGNVQDTQRAVNDVNLDIEAARCRTKHRIGKTISSLTSLSYRRRHITITISQTDTNGIQRFISLENSSIRIWQINSLSFIGPPCP